MTFASIRKFCRQTVRITHVALVCVMTAYAPIASSVEIVLGTAMKVRTSDDDGLSAIGVLAKGSVVEVPDRYKKLKADGTVDAAATFNNWLKQSGYTNSQISQRKRSQYQDFYYPVRIVSMAPGSRGKNLVGTTRFMALRVLERSSGGLRVKENSRVYNGSRNLQPIRGQGNPGQALARPAPRPAPAAPAARPAPRAQNAEDQSQDSQQDDQQQQQDSQDQQPADDQQPQAQDQAQDDQDPNAGTEAQSGTGVDCPTCRHQQEELAAGDQADDIRSTMPAIYNSESDGLQGLPSSMPGACSAFIKSDGSYGPWGQIAVRELSRYPGTFLRASGMSSVCPNFNKVDSNGRPMMNDAERRHFWVYLLTAIAAQESTCNPNVDSPQKMIKVHGRLVKFNPNGIASGLFQIEKDPDLRAGRDDRYGGRFCSGNVYSPDTNTRCAVRMLEDIVDNGRGPYTMENHYWSVLINSGTKTRRWISQYKACGATPVAVASGSHKHHGKKTKHRRRA